MGKAKWVTAIAEQEAKTRVLHIALFLGLAASLAGGCGMGKAKGEAEQVAAAFFDALRQQDHEAAMELFSEKFFEETSREEWRNILDKVGEKLGTPESRKLVRWYVFAGKDKRGLSGTTVDLSYEVTYEKYPAQVFMVVNRPLRGGDFKIVSMNINSRGLLLE